MLIHLSGAGSTCQSRFDLWPVPRAHFFFGAMNIAIHLDVGSLVKYSLHKLPEVVWQQT